jgi:hypothetical protein
VASTLWTPEDDENALVPANSKYRLPSEPQKLIVTPEMASDWLSYRNHPKNRPLSAARASRYQALMNEGLFRAGTPEGYIFDTDGYIISAQHRLKAQANGNHTLEMWIFPNEPREIFEYVDQGYSRTAAHLMRVKYATHLASGARILAALGDNDRYGVPRYSRISNQEVLETFHGWPELEWYASELHEAARLGGAPMGPHAAVLAQAARTPYRNKIENWLEQVTTGANIDQTDPAWHLRRKFLVTGVNVKRGAAAVAVNYALLAKAWNGFALGEDMNVLRFAYSDPLPEVVDHPRTAIKSPREDA